MVGSAGEAVMLRSKLLCVLLGLGLCAGVQAEGNKVDPLFADVPQEHDRDLVVEIVDWGWVGALMRRGRLRIRERDFNRALSTLAQSSKKGLTNKDIQGGLQGAARSSRGTAKGLLTAVQNIVILVDITGKAYVWNRASGEPVPIPESNLLFEQIEKAIADQPTTRRPVPTVSKQEYLEEFEAAREAEYPPQ
jgi:hypothetical protein